MRREVWTVPAPTLGGERTVMVYGHWGVPVLFFPAEGGSAWDIEDNGIIHALAEPIEAGRLKVFCVPSHDHEAWSNRDAPLEERARRHEAYHGWITYDIVRAIHHDCGGPLDIATAGASMGAYHAVNFALKRADLFPYALGMSGNYDPTTWHGWGEQGDAVYFNNPFAYIANADGDHLAWLRQRVFIQLVVGTGPWEEWPSRALPSTVAFADLLRSKGIGVDLDMWGRDSPHDWPSWCRQAAKHLGNLGG
jgi:esterase/lipase superfamily enzyme